MGNPQFWTLWIGTPLIGGIIGWVTNYLAIRMLFHPHREIRLPFLRIQGLIPRRQRELAESIAATVSGKLLQGADLKAKLVDPALQTHIHDVLVSRIEQVFAELIQKLPPFIAAMVPASALQSVREHVVTELMGNIPAILDAGMDYLEKQNTIHAIVRDKILALNLDELERLVLEIAGRELRQIEWLGGVLGALIGLLNAALLQFIH